MFTGASAWLAGEGDVNQRMSFYTAWGLAQSLRSERKRKVRNKKERVRLQNYTFVGLQYFPSVSQCTAVFV